MVTLKDLLKDKLTKEELNKLITSFDVIGSREKGSVAIIEIPEELENKEKLIGEAVMELQKNIKSVLKKGSERKDTYRLREYEVVAGSKDTEVVHKENNVRILLNPRKVFFSPRESTERDYIASLVNPNETVMVFFAGAGPYVINIAKKTGAEVYGIEINPDAVDYMKKNIKLNKINGHAILGDVKQEYKNYIGKFDRVVMPLAKHAYQFLDEAVQVLRENGTIHFYHVGPEEEPFKEAIHLLEKSANKFNKRIEIENKRLMTQYASRVWKVVIDARII